MWEGWQRKNTRRKALERRKKHRAMVILQIKKATREWELRELAKERQFQKLHERFLKHSDPDPWMRVVTALGWD